MRSLFLKIFLWFWAANLSLAAIAITAALLLKTPDSDSTIWRSVASNALREQSRAVLDVYEQFGEEKLFDYLNLQDADAGIHTFLIDSSGRDLGGHTVPDKLDALVETARMSGNLELKEENGMSMVAVTIKSKKGQTLVFAREMLSSGERFRGPPAPRGDRLDERGPRERPGPPPFDFDPDSAHSSGDRPTPSPGMRGRPPRRPMPTPLFFQRILNDPGTIAGILCALAIAGGAVCYGLARYLTKPVQSIRLAAKKLADGDLAVRVGTKAGQRRDEIADLASDFDHMAERLQSLVTAQQRLVRDVSHELRSPLARLSVSLELVSRAAGESAGEPLQRAQSEIGRLNELIGQLLALSRLESHADAPKLIRIDFCELVRQAVADADFEATASNRSVRAELGEPCWVMGAPELLRSAIENILRNAVAYTAPETTVQVVLRRVEKNGTTVADLTIHDHGPGVPEAHLQNIFRPFFRVSESRESETGGNGIGLAIADRAVRLHRGNIEAENATNGGLVVRVTIPCA